MFPHFFLLHQSLALGSCARHFSIYTIGPRRRGGILQTSDQTSSIVVNRTRVTDSLSRGLSRTDRSLKKNDRICICTYLLQVRRPFRTIEHNAVRERSCNWDAAVTIVITPTIIVSRDFPPHSRADTDRAIEHAYSLRYRPAVFFFFCTRTFLVSADAYFLQLEREKLTSRRAAIVFRIF